ncbi:LamG-like jellyroll fold domain-containing protein [Flavobacterium sp.]|uniref:Ig-like domain-containing protein n=1 Tax=Flavobacterium sp. TaxID=239 RepID=UPI003795F439
MKKNLLQKPIHSFSRIKTLVKTLAMLVLFILLGNNAFSQTGAALNFDGTNDNVTINSSLGNFGTSDFTIEFQIKTSFQNYYVLSKRGVCDNDNFLSISLGNGKISVETSNINVLGSSASLNGNTFISDNVWHKISISRNAGVLTLYVDGVQDAQFLPTTPENTNIDLNNNYVLQLGGFAPCTPYISNQVLIGSVDEVRIWNRALSQTEIQNTMGCELQAGQTGLLAYYQFNQGVDNADNTANTTLTDSSGNNNAGTLNNFTLTGPTSNWVTAGAVTTTPVPTRDLSINGTLCDGATIGTLISKFNNNANVSCFSNAIGGSPLDVNTVISPTSANITFYLSQNSNGCESARVAYTAYVNVTSPPTAAAQTFCDAATVANLVATTVNFGCCLKWYDVATGGTALAGSTALTTGTYYVTQNSISGCESLRTPVSVTVTPSTTNTTKVTACGSYLWAVNGITYTNSGNFSVVTGCDTENLILTINTTPIPNPIDNQVFCSNQVTNPIIANKICGMANEGQDIQLTTPAGFVFTAVPFASYGTPNGSCGNFTLGSCDATNSVSIVSGLVLGQNSAMVSAINGVFGDPCGGTPKRLYVEATYGTVSSWTNDTPSIGLAATGTGIIPSFTAVNNTGIPIVATITVVINNGTCDSAPQTFTITINPIINNTTTITACNSYVWAADGNTYTNSGNYMVITGCDTENLALTINSTPAPRGASTQVYTGTITLADLNVSGSDIKWYDAPTEENLLDNTTVLIDGTTYYASQTLTSCESASLLAVTAKKISEATQNLCTGAMASDLVSTSSTTAMWYASSKGQTALAPTDLLATGTYYAAQTTPETTTNLPVAGLYYPNGITVQADGRILVADSSGSIIRMNPDGSNVVSLGSGFYYPQGVAEQSDGTILVADTYNQAIKRMNADGSNIVLLGSGFSYPSAVTIQADGKILVADSNNNVIKRMDADGSNIVSLGSGFGWITGVTVEADGTILVVDNGNSAIYSMNADGSNIVSLGSGFSNPIGVAVQADGSIIVTDSNNSAIKRMNADGSNIVSIGSGFNWPMGVAIQADDSILVADNGNNTVEKITLASITNRVPVGVTVGTPAPTGTASQTFCGSETVSLLNVTGTGIIWYDAATLGTVIPDSTVLVDGTTYYASQTISGCESSSRLAITANVGACLGLDNFDITNLQWYPNPTTGKLNINYSKTIDEVSVINLLGQTLFTNKPKATEVQIDLSKLPTSSYFIKVVSDGKSKTIKVIKQ